MMQLYTARLRKKRSLNNIEKLMYAENIVPWSALSLQSQTSADPAGANTIHSISLHRLTRKL